MSFVVIEGLDGSGKSTQIKLLQQYLKKNNVSFEYLHFPRIESPVYGEMVAKFLRGDLGNIGDVNPYLVALLYAGDRQNAATMINKWLENKLFVLTDRYVLSNIAFQCAKLQSQIEKETLRNWILDMEYNHFSIPKPDFTLFLDVPFSFTAHNLSNERNGDDRNYLQGKKDIHEQDLSFQENVRKTYLWHAEKDQTIKVLPCYNESGDVLSPELIFEKITQSLQNYLPK